MVFDVYLSFGMVSTFIPQVAAISRSWASVVKDSSSVARLNLKMRVDSSSVNRVRRCLEVLAEFPSRIIIIPCGRSRPAHFNSNDR